MSRIAKVGEKLNINQRKAQNRASDLNAFIRIRSKYYSDQRRLLKGNSDAEFFLEHNYMLKNVARALYPGTENEEIRIATSLVDIKYLEELKLLGKFVGRINSTDYDMGVIALDKLWLDEGKACKDAGKIESLTYQKVRNAVLYYDSAKFDTEGKPIALPKDLIGANIKDLDIVKGVGEIYSVISPVVTIRNFRREQQIISKWDKDVSIECFAKMQQGIDFDQSLCKTHADDLLHALALVTKNLMSKDKKIVEEQLKILGKSTSEVLYLNGEGKPASKDEIFFIHNSDGTISFKNKLGKVYYNKGFEAIKAIIEDSINPEIAKQVLQAFDDAIKQAVGYVENKGLRQAMQIGAKGKDTTHSVQMIKEK